MKTEIIGIQSHPSHNDRAKNDRAKNDRAAARRKGADPAQLYSKIVEQYAMFFDRPEARLRFLNNTLTKQAQRQAQFQQSLRRFRFLERTPFYDWLFEARVYCAILEEMRALAPSLPGAQRKRALQIQAPFSARVFSLIHQSRHAFYAAGVIVAGLMVFGLYSLVTWSARNVNSYLAQRYKGKNSQIVINTYGPTPGNEFTETAGRILAHYKPENVWLVESNEEYEKYSNRCRILTKYETDNHPRGYYTIPRESDTDGDQMSDRIVGIVYHTSESDIVSFTSDNNEAIQKRSRGLLEYARDHKSYNYLIDRYGDVYRIVRDEHAAYHAGDSIWADAKNTYALLNESFLGVCFESTVKGETLEETLTEAQITAGRELTNVLRSKYNIDDANCTTHGLVAVDPEKMLIARKHDWVRNFPFEAMGLSDKYKIQPPNMSDYGFTYDEDVLAKLDNKLWAGAVAAEEEFKRRAEKARISPDVLRRKLRDRYISQREKTRRLRAGPGDADNPQLAEKPSGAAESTESGNN
ncbi:MAG: N-acetylmuramoyl-L-alanine amidase [Blastocatellia bacterium]